MKKIFVFLLTIISMNLFVFKVYANVFIPKDAIRFRILANSDSKHDQSVKEKVRDKLQTKLYDDLKDANNKNEAKTIVKSSIPSYKTIINDNLKNESYSFKIDYGMHKFPQKVYKGVIYQEGNYESLLVTLGKGKGKNWWCVLFPPLCVVESEETMPKTKTEYKFLIKDILSKYFK